MALERWQFKRGNLKVAIKRWQSRVWQCKGGNQKAWQSTGGNQNVAAAARGVRLLTPLAAHPLSTRSTASLRLWHNGKKIKYSVLTHTRWRQQAGGFGKGVGSIQTWAPFRRGGQVGLFAPSNLNTHGTQQSLGTSGRVRMAAPSHGKAMRLRACKQIRRRRKCWCLFGDRHTRRGPADGPPRRGRVHLQSVGAAPLV